MISTTQYESAAQLYFKQNPTLEQKFYSPTLLKTLVDAMQSSLPTVTAAKITFDGLVANGTLRRTDGKSDRDDAQANLDKSIAEVEAAPLTTNELEYFGSLSQRDLSTKYYGPDGDAVCDFAVRYRKAVRGFGFVVPPKFGDQTVSDGGEVQLTAAQYHSIPSAELQRRLRIPSFKLAVYKLLQNGEI